jgi:glycosyltransferase involved in cell wall biosynthesis
MKLAAVMTVLNEADIIGATLTHLYTEGVANVYIYDGMSTDGTRDVLAGFPCKVFDDEAPIHRQPFLTTQLAQMAYEDGADWVLPVDADEFWVAPSGRTIAEELATVPDHVVKVYVPMYQHLDYDYREPNPKPLPKVAFRAADGIWVANGNHEAATTGATTFGLLALREIQYRGFEHFVRKIEERCATLDPSLPAGEGTHHTQYRGWTKEQLEPVWETLVGRATVLDPIPLRT